MDKEFDEKGWQLERVIEVPGGVRDLAIWSPVDTQSCSGLDVELGKKEDISVFEVIP